MVEVLYRLVNEYVFQLVFAELILVGEVKKEQSVGKRIGTILVTAAFIIGYDLLCVYAERPQSVAVRDAGLALVFLLTLCCYYLLFNCTVNEIIFCGVFAYAVQNFNYNMLKIAKYLIKVDENTLAGLFVTIIVMGVIYFIMYRVFSYYSQEYKIDDINRTNVITNALFLLLFTTFFPVLFDEYTNSGSVAYLLYGLLGDVLVLYIQISMLREGKLIRENAMLEQMIRTKQEQYEISKENIELINLKCHDMRHQINSLYFSQNESMQTDMVDELEHVISVYDTNIDTGNETLNVLLMEKALYCEQNKIRLTCIVDGSRMNFIKPGDIYSIFGNLIENAIESVEQENDEEKRIISLNISSLGECLKIQIYNYFDGKLDFVDGLPKTKKGEDFHGYGLRSVRFIIQKYGGSMNISNENDLFMVTMLIPIS